MSCLYAGLGIIESVLLSKFAVGQIIVNIMVKESSELQSGGEVIIFNTEDGDVQVQVDTVKETVWMTQKGMAELFGVSVPAINQHVKNVYQEGELLEAATVKKNLIVQSEGSRKVQRNVTASVPLPSASGQPRC